MSDLRKLGRIAEDQAANYLLSLGWTILGRRQRVGALEIDLVALEPGKDSEVVFIEVKSRSQVRWLPEDSVSVEKLERLKRAMTKYLDQFELFEASVRIDLIAITPNEIRHHRDILSERLELSHEEIDHHDESISRNGDA